VTQRLQAAIIIGQWSEWTHLSLHCETMNTGLVHCVGCLFTPQLSLVLIVHLRPSTEGWPHWVDLGSWSHTEMVYKTVMVLTVIRLRAKFMSSFSWTAPEKNCLANLTKYNELKLLTL